MQEYNIDFRYRILVLGQCRQSLPFRIGAESFPVCISFGTVVETGHIHEIGHMATRYYLRIKHSIEAQALE